MEITAVVEVVDSKERLIFTATLVSDHPDWITALSEVQSGIQNLVNAAKKQDWKVI